MILYCGLLCGLDSDKRVETWKQLKSFWGMRAALGYLKGKENKSKWIPVRNKFGDAPGDPDSVTEMVGRIIKGILVEVEKVVKTREERLAEEKREAAKGAKR